MSGAEGKIAKTPIPQIAKQTIGVPRSSSHPPQPSGIAMSLIEMEVIFAAISEA
jgi:hypothetical protein